MATYYLESHDLQAFKKNINGIPKNNTENLAFLDLYGAMETLRINGQELEQIGQVERQTVMQVASNTSTVVANAAQSLLMMIDQSALDRAPEVMPNIKKDPNKTGSTLLGEIEQIQLYPNPASEKVNISWQTSTGTGNIKFIDLAGKVIFDRSINLENGMALINISQLPVGIYLIQVKASSSIITTKKLVVLKY